MDFGLHKTPVEVIKKARSGGTYLRDIYCGVNGKWYRKPWKEFHELRDIDQTFYCSNYYDISVDKYGVKCKKLLRFCENKCWINPVDPCGWFQWYFRYWLGERSLDDERQINRWEGVVSSFNSR